MHRLDPRLGVLLLTPETTFCLYSWGMTQCHWDLPRTELIPCKCSLAVTLYEVSLEEDSIYLNTGHSEGEKKTIKNSWASQSQMIRDFTMHFSLLKVSLSLNTCTFLLLKHNLDQIPLFKVDHCSKPESLALRCALPNTSLGVSLKLAEPVAQNCDFCRFAFNHLS